MRPKATASRAANLICSSVPEIIPGDDDLIKKLEWLENNAGPFEKGLKYWEETRQERYKILHNTQISTHSYLEKFPILDTVEGFKLVNKF